jgi:hypothetical protein
MSATPSFVRRVGIAKTVGFAFGLALFFLVPYIWPSEGLPLRVGLLLWYTTMGAIVGIFGVIDFHPLFRFPMPFWFRGAIVGGWMNFVLVLLMWEKLTVLFESMIGPMYFLDNPLWLVPEGMIVGFLIDALSTRTAGEGKIVLEQ